MSIFDNIKNFFRGFTKRKERADGGVTTPVGPTQRKPPKMFYSKKLNDGHRRLLNLAMRKGNDVTIRYRKKNGDLVTRKVTPYTAKNRNLLVGFDHERGALRSFRVDQIEHL